MPAQPSRLKVPPHRERWLIVVFVVALGLYAAWKSAQQPAAKPQPAPADVQVKQPVQEAEPAEDDADSAEAAAKKVKTRIPSVTVRDQDGKVLFRGTVDVGPTLRRIRRGEQLRFPHDGTVFQNRERRLPAKAAGYYREYVHPTEGVGGPGPQRIVQGKGGETFYTHDHYRTFQRLDAP